MTHQLALPKVHPLSRSPWLKRVKSAVPEAVHGILHYRESVLFDGTSAEVLRDAVEGDSCRSIRDAVDPILSWKMPKKKRHLVMVAEALLGIYDEEGGSI